MWVIKSETGNTELAKAIGVSRTCINNFKKAQNDLDHPHLLALGFALGKTYYQITFISEEDKKQLDNK